ncbi:MAG TPA: helix-turn-helix transcriptional regulator [Candidatus Cottocaccamicrobium excrementipullorum]|nr:helix-turn-helix transcriptional regulator [Candidatus Cottocaccamicrobium excrementipullorum]
MITYEPFFDTLKRKHITTYYLVNKCGFSKGTLDSLKQGRNINISTLDYLCELLDCGPEDIIRYTPKRSEDAEKNPGKD